MTSARRATALLQREAQVRARGLPRWRQTEQQADAQSGQQHEDESAHVQVRIEHHRKENHREHSPRQVHKPRSAGNAGRRAQHREQHTFGKQLADDTSAAGADGQTDGDFPLALRRAHQQQVGDVGRDDEQHQTRHGEHHA